VGVGKKKLFLGVGLGYAAKLLLFVLVLRFRSLNIAFNKYEI